MVDYRKKLGPLGVWWTFQNLNVVGVHVGVQTEGAGVGRLVQDVVWEETLLPTPLAQAE